jgi:hypothetical protein
MKFVHAAILVLVAQYVPTGYARADPNQDAISDEFYQNALQGSPAEEFLRAENYESGRDGRPPNYAMGYVWRGLAVMAWAPSGSISSTANVLAMFDLFNPQSKVDEAHMSAAQRKNADDRIEAIVNDRMAGMFPDICEESADQNGECDFSSPIQQ